MSTDSSKPEPGREPEPRPDAEVLPAERGELEVVSAASIGDLVPTEPLGWIDKFKLATLHSKKELQAVAVVLDTQLDQLRHRADAASRASKTYWDAKSAEVVAAMKTYVQAQLRGVENERMANRLDSLRAAYELFAEKVREVESGSLPEEMRESLIQKMHENLAGTLERIEKDAIAQSHDLTD